MKENKHWIFNFIELNENTFHLICYVVKRLFWYPNPHFWIHLFVRVVYNDFLCLFYSIMTYLCTILLTMDHFFETWNLVGIHLMMEPGRLWIQMLSILLWFWSWFGKKIGKISKLWTSPCDQFCFKICVHKSHLHISLVVWGANSIIEFHLYGHAQERPSILHVLIYNKDVIMYREVQLFFRFLLGTKFLDFSPTTSNFEF